MTPEITIVTPTLGRLELLRRMIERLERQTVQSEAMELVVVADALEADVTAVDASLRGKRFQARRLQAGRPGASAARNVGWRAARAPLVLFLDDDVLPEPELVEQHLEWHRRDPAAEVGVLGHVRWADEIRITPFLRWLDDGIQFSFTRIEGEEAEWGFFVTANASLKRELLERVGGFDEVNLPFGYEDLDFSYRARDHGFRLMYNRRAVAEHLHRMDLDFWRRRVRRIAQSEAQFVRLHPDFEPYFYKKFASAAAAPPARGRGEWLARFVPRAMPLLGPWTWRSVDGVYKQALAGPFLEAWEAAQRDQAEPAASSGGADPAGPK